MMVRIGCIVEASLFDIEHARQADSFDKCYRDIVRLLEELQKAAIQ